MGTYQEELQALEDVISAKNNQLSDAKTSIRSAVTDGSWKNSMTALERAALKDEVTYYEGLVEDAKDARDAYVNTYNAKVKAINTDALAAFEAERIALKNIKIAEIADKLDYMDRFGQDIQLANYVSDWKAYLAANPTETDLSNYTENWASV